MSYRKLFWAWLVAFVDLYLTRHVLGLYVACAMRRCYCTGGAVHPTILIELSRGSRREPAGMATFVSAHTASPARTSSKEHVKRIILPSEILVLTSTL